MPSGVAPVSEIISQPSTLLACCSAVYGNPLAELLVGESLHPGGLESTRQLLAWSRLEPGARLLDAGCGLGAGARVAAREFGLRVDGVDASQEVLTRAEARDPGAGVTWLRADLLALPHEDAAFDGILSECVLSTLHRGDALAEMRRALRPGGLLLVSDVEVGGSSIPALADLGILGAALCITDAWRTDELEARLGPAGFSLLRRWDRTASILTLVDRIEARVKLAAAAARDLGLDLATLASLPGLRAAPVDHAAARRLGDEVRRAVHRGDLRYFAAVARAVDFA